MQNQIITSLLDTDFYKFSMMQAVNNQYPTAGAEYKFVCRNKDIKLGFLKEEVKKEINSIHTSLQKEERDFLANKTLLNKDFCYSDVFNAMEQREICVYGSDDLTINICGQWNNTILWEVPILSIVNELYFRHTTNFEDIRKEGEKRLKDKVDMLKDYPDIKIFEFGTRRRYSKQWQEYVIKYLVENCKNLKGTSNIYFAKKFGINPVGTVAHEWFSAHINLVDRIENAQKRALYVWLQEYKGSLDIALTDTFTSDAFFQDFDSVLSNTYSGLRQDSGCPFEFGEKAIKHYENMGIDPNTKVIIFSDSLDIPKVIEIYKYFKDKIMVSFGVGTNLTNDLGIKSLNIVIKLVKLNGRPVVKLSDNPEKAIGDKGLINKIRKIYGV